MTWTLTYQGRRRRRALRSRWEAGSQTALASVKACKRQRVFTGPWHARGRGCSQGHGTQALAFLACSTYAAYDMLLFELSQKSPHHSGLRVPIGLAASLPARAEMFGEGAAGTALNHIGPACCIVWWGA